jgi:formamidopyrimidine-DNA glycosylase
LSPFVMTRSVSADNVRQLFDAVRGVMSEWTQRLREQSPGWPEKVTAFRPEMAVHGRYGLPCPVCNTPVQRILYASNESNYCARCQTGGTLLADRVLSKLLKDSWPKSVDDL